LVALAGVGATGVADYSAFTAIRAPPSRASAFGRRSFVAGALGQMRVAVAREAQVDAAHLQSLPDRTSGTGRAALSTTSRAVRTVQATPLP